MLTPTSPEHKTHLINNLPSFSQFYTSSIGEHSGGKNKASYKEQLEEARKTGQASWPEGSTYTIIDAIAVGGMGAILRARANEAGRDVAMKVMLRADIDSPASKRFIREARIVGNLEHPNIVPVHDIGISPLGEPYFTMKWVKGETLAEILYKIRKEEPAYLAKYNLGTLLDIFTKVCDGVAFAHSRHVVHLDLKPHNILVGDYGEVLVLDWGLAAMISKERKGQQLAFVNIEDRDERSSYSSGKFDYGLFTEDGTIKGTPGFMAPEQANGKIDEIDQRADIYSLGSILYMILTLKFPIVGENPSEILEHTIAGNFVPPGQRTQDQNVPNPLEGIVMKAMQTDRMKRYHLVQHLQSDVNAFIMGQVTSVEHYSALKRLSLFFKRHKTEVLSLAASFFIIGILVTIFVLKLDYHISEANQERQKSRNYFQSALAARNVAAENRKMASENKQEAESALGLADFNSYLANIRLSEISVRDLRFDIAGEALRQSPVKFRHWEWGHLRHLTQLYTMSFPIAKSGKSVHIDSGRNVLAYQESDHDIVLRNYRTGAVVDTFEREGDSIVRFAVSRDATTLFIATDSNDLEVWTLSPRKQIGSIEQYSAAISAALFLDNGSLVALGTDVGTVVIWDPKTGKRPRTIKAHPGEVTALAVDTPRSRLITAGSRGDVKLWDYTTARFISNINAHNTAVTAIAMNSIRGSIVTAGLDQTIKIWKANDGTLRRAIELGTDNVTSLDISDETGVIIAADGTPTITLWNANTGERFAAINGHNGSVEAVAITDDGSTIFSLGRDDTVKIWDRWRAVEPRRLTGIEGSTFAADFSPNNEFVATGGIDRAARLWRPEKGTIWKSYRGHRDTITDLCFSHDSERLVTASNDQTIIIWDITKERPQWTLRGHTDGVNAVVISRDDRRILSGSNDGTARMWNAVNGLLLFTLPAHQQPVNDVAFAADGEICATAGADATVRIWSTENGEEIAKLSDFRHPVTAIYFNADSSALLAGDANGEITIWDLEAMAQTKTLKGHMARINSVRLSPDGSRLFSCSDDGTVKVWDIESGANLAVLKGHRGAIRSCRASSDARQLITCGIDGQIMIWSSADWRDSEAL